jgi:hypothetical protein
LAAIDKERMAVEDARIFHKFETNDVIIEVTQHEETFENLKTVSFCLIMKHIH